MLLKSSITEEKIKANKEYYISLLRSVKREGIEDLIDYLENKTDFFTAPASTKYHGVFKGGLCEHCLAVYNILYMLNGVYENVTGEKIDGDSIIISALLHDLSKTNTYEETYSNKKIYSPTGKKYDEAGNFDWVSVKSYKMIDVEDRFLYVNHEMGSEFIARQFIQLTIQESVAICVHHGGMDSLSLPASTVGQNYGKYPLALLLHEADLMAAYTCA